MPRVKIAFVNNVDSEIIAVSDAAAKLAEKYSSEIEICLRNPYDLKKDEEAFADFTAEIKDVKLLLVTLHGGKSTFPELDRLAEEAKRAVVPLHAQETADEPDIELIALSTVEKDVFKKISEYIRYGGSSNYKNLFLYVASIFSDANYDFEEPKQLPWEGIYHPDIEGEPQIEEYLEKKYVKGRPTIGLWFYQNMWLSGNISFIDTVIREIESRSINVIPVFISSAKPVEGGSKGSSWVINNYFMKDGKPLIDSLISPLMFSQTMMAGKGKDGAEMMLREAGNFFMDLGVPIIKAMVTYNTYKTWRENFQGLSVMDVTNSVAMSEFDGMIINVPIAAREITQADPITGVRITRFIPIQERIKRAVSLAHNWAKLRHIPNEKKKVAIIFHNYPPRDDKIGGAFGLDSPVSVYNIIRELEADGYKLDRLPEDGKELIDAVRAGVTNDRRWSTPAQMAAKAVDVVPASLYRKWFKEIPAGIRVKMDSSWGEAPGKLYVHEDNIIIPGIINGNVFIGLQPPRGFLEDPASIYHSPDHPIPHHYLAYYRWIRDVFGANLIMHIGKHGTLEWLPGKTVGLSESCFPDMAISDIPHMYHYIINNPGEGTQAKRRSYCCLVDHLIPVMNNADSYEEMAELDVQLNNYYQAKTEDPKKLPHLQEQIWENVIKAKLDSDLNVKKKDAFSGFDDFLEKLHDYIYEVVDTQIRDGLHILGEPPQEEKLTEFLVALTRLSNGEVPSLRESLAKELGYDYNHLLKNRGKVMDGLKTGGQIIKEVHQFSLELVSYLEENDFSKESLERLIKDKLNGKASNKLRKSFDYIMGTLKDKVAQTTDELKHTVLGGNGGYVPPGPSGPPTRGMADILPTGRNFYSVDPQAIPSPSAWRVGKDLGDAMLKRYLEEEGRYPESIGTIIFATGTMRTRGDDIAETLYLMGARPIWEQTSGRVKRVEPIPLAELGRPGIDATLRISGMFRDAFPNVVNLVDDAVEMIAGLDELPEDNYIRKNYLADLEQKMGEGKSEAQAKEESLYRIFGDRPGAYGAGVSDLIFAKNWKDDKDLAEVYTTWGGYAYTKRKYGVEVPEEFKRRLGKMDATFKNEDSREWDMLDSDDFYSYHGGMIAAVRAIKGKNPISYCGDSSDPNRIKVRTTFEEAKHAFRARILNPKWLDSMKRHGYKGAGDISSVVDYCFGWDATAEVLEDWMYESMAQKYALDKNMQDWLKEVNPHALENITERLLEAIERNMWNAPKEMEDELKKIYLDIEGELEESND